MFTLVLTAALTLALFKTMLLLAWAQLFLVEPLLNHSVFSLLALCWEKVRPYPLARSLSEALPTTSATLHRKKST
jgi:hypothetical protein